jgi:hypothetical protein
MPVWAFLEQETVRVGDVVRNRVTQVSSYRLASFLKLAFTKVMQKTTSEIFFEQFCTQHGVRWEQIAIQATDGVKTPDYAIFPKETKVIVEVKEVQENATERQQREQFERVGWSTFGNGKVGDRARDIIETAAKQLKRMAKGKHPAMVVIYNPSFLLRHHTEPHAIKAAMYGFDQYVLGLAPIHMRKEPRLIDRQSGPGRKMGSHFNTTISAVAVLDGDGLTIYHNVFAAIPLRVELFSGIAVRQFRLGEKQPAEFEKWQKVDSAI